MPGNNLHFFNRAVRRDKSFQFNPALNKSEMGETWILKTHDSPSGEF